MTDLRSFPTELLRSSPGLGEPAVYLCSPISGVPWEQSFGWRARFTERLEDVGLRALNPLRAEMYLEGMSAMPSEVPGSKFSVGKIVTRRDRFDVQNCSIMVANLSIADYVSPGCPIEFGWADAYRKPIVTIMGEGSPYDHPMIREISTGIVPDEDDAFEFVCILMGVRP